MGWYRSESTDVWDPANTRVLSVALDDACRRADEAGLTVDRFGEAARDVLARRIIMLAKHGVLEHQRLVDDALRGLQR